jgi:hypothetical protein
MFAWDSAYNELEYESQMGPIRDITKLTHVVWKQAKKTNEAMQHEILYIWHSRPTESEERKKLGKKN